MDPLVAANSPDVLPPGTTLGRYEIRRMVGRGGMGSVYEAVHRDLKKRVAIKTLLPALAANADAKTRFLREGEAASRIRHPHVVDVTDVGAEGSVIYLVMEYLEGEDLGKVIARRGALGISETADIMLPVVAAIATAHDQGVIHRDLKPENIFLANAAMGGIQPKVLDFGISKVSGDLRTMALTGTGATFGTTFYLPPEQLRGAKQADARSDQYALGTIIYECVTGQRAFEGENLYAVLKDIAESHYTPPSALRPDLPPELAAIINRAMSLDPAARFASARMLGAALLGYGSGGVRMMWTPFFGAPPEISLSPTSDLVNPNAAPSGSQRTPDPLSNRGFGAATPPPRSDPLSSSSRRSSAGGTRVLPPDSLTPAPGSRSGGQPSRVESSTTFRHASGESAALPTMPVRRSRVPLFVGIGVVVAVGAVFLVMRPGDDQTSARTRTTAPVTTPAVAPEPKTFRVEVVTDPSSAVIELDGQAVGTGAFARRLPVDGSEHEIVAHTRGYRNASVRFVDAPPPRDLTLEAIAALPPVAIEPAPATEPVVDGKPITGALGKPEKPGHGRHHGGGKPGGADSGEPAKPGPGKPAGKSGKSGGDPNLLPNNAPIVE